MSKGTLQAFLPQYDTHMIEKIAKGHFNEKDIAGFVFISINVLSTAPPHKWVECKHTIQANWTHNSEAYATRAASGYVYGYPVTPRQLTNITLGRGCDSCWDHYLEIRHDEEGIEDAICAWRDPYFDVELYLEEQQEQKI